MSNPNPSPKTRFKPGQSGNPSGRPKGGLKVYDRKRFAAMTDEQKEEFLQTISPELRYRMAEGNPQNATDLTSDGKPLFNEETKQKTKQAIQEIVDRGDTGQGGETGD